MNTAREIAEILRKNSGKNVVLATHINPDGDAFGSLTALGHLVAQLNCNVMVLLEAGKPKQFDWIDLPWNIVPSLKDLGDFVPDLVLVSDCGDARRAGSELSEYFLKGTLPTPEWKKTESINIDHHEGNPEFAQYNFVLPYRASSTELVAELAHALGATLSGGLGEAIYLGIVTDSGDFSYASTSAYTHSLAGEILQEGLLLGPFTSNLENSWSVGRMNLWGAMMAAIESHEQGTIATCVVTLEMMNKYHCDKDELEGFASWIRRLKGVKVSVFVRQDEAEKCKISLRTMGDIDIRPVAIAFGGGGHKAASGADVLLPPEKVVSAILEKLVPLVKKA